VIILVKQFRPGKVDKSSSKPCQPGFNVPLIYASAVYLSNVREEDKGFDAEIDTRKYPAHLGFTLELCAGIVDKNKSLEEIACEEVQEECGYSVKATDLQKIIQYRSIYITNPIV
jgi:8-oxo-dGTP pyrophosphatase MutT (NUDIX family)